MSMQMEHEQAGRIETPSDALGASSSASPAEQLDQMLEAGLAQRAPEPPPAFAALTPAPAETDRPTQGAFFELAAKLLESEEGLRLLASRAHRFDDAGVFTGGPWEDPAQLQVPLVAGTLRAPGITPIVETLSELRTLAIATGRGRSESFTADDARRFLNEVMARNLTYLLGGEGGTEADREEGDAHRASHERLFHLIANEIGLDDVLEEVVDEIEHVLAQRPVSTRSVRRMIARAMRLAEEQSLEGSATDALRRFSTAADGPSPLGREHADPLAYAAALKEIDRDTLEAEASACAASMLETGLVAPSHGLLVRRLSASAPDLLPTALGLDDAGRIEFEQNEELVHSLIDDAVFASTAQCLYGFRAALERTLFSRPEVAAGLERLRSDLEIREEVAENLLAQRSPGESITPNAVLLAGTIAVLGQPLGIGQGRNPTCQSARGMSLWAQHDPAHLLELIVAAARDGGLDLPFKGERVRSAELVHGVGGEIDLDLDPVSIVLVPHLDRLYSELMRRSALVLEDAHKWVNPALYGHWIPNELASAFSDLAQTTVAGFRTFVRCFYTTHHPEYNGGLPLMYPNPVGLVITNHLGSYLGPHAVSIQRVAEAPDGEVRVYFYNPNNEGRQDWGDGVITSVTGHGEEPGESSLPFADFAARVYAFHYNPFEEGEHPAVPNDVVDAVTTAARTTWGRRFTWLEDQAA